MAYVAYADIGSGKDVQGDPSHYIEPTEAQIPSRGGGVFHIAGGFAGGMAAGPLGRALSIVPHCCAVFRGCGR